MLDHNHICLFVNHTHAQMNRKSTNSEVLPVLRTVLSHTRISVRIYALLSCSDDPSSLVCCSTNLSLSQFHSVLSHPVLTRFLVFFHSFSPDHSSCFDNLHLYSSVIYCVSPDISRPHLSSLQFLPRIASLLFVSLLIPPFLFLSGFSSCFACYFYAPLVSSFVLILSPHLFLLVCFSHPHRLCRCVFSLRITPRHAPPIDTPYSLQ